MCLYLFLLQALLPLSPPYSRLFSHGEHSLILVSLGTCRSPFLGTHALLLFLLSLSPYIGNPWPDLYRFEMTNDAAEATQDAYLRAWRGLRSFRGDAAFGTWLYRVAANAALSKHRSRKRKSGLDSGYEDDALERIPSPRSTEDTATARIQVGELEKALADLPEHYRAAVVLRDIYGMSTEEIAKELGVSTTAAKVRVHRGRKMLRVAMFPPEESEGTE